MVNVVKCALHVEPGRLGVLTRGIQPNCWLLCLKFLAATELVCPVDIHIVRPECPCRASLYLLLARHLWLVKLIVSQHPHADLLNTLYLCIQQVV